MLVKVVTVITGMAMELTIKKLLVVLLSSVVALPSLSGEWQFDPSLSTEETYTDNVELTIVDPTASFVNQLMAGLDAEYQSSLASLSFSGTQSYMLYSHNSKLNDNFRTLNTNGALSLWRNGPTLIGSASIANISRNNADNSLADLVSGDTIESRSYSGGLQYNFGNTSYSVESSVIYNSINYEDGLSDSDGFTAKLNSKNGTSARLVFWQLASNYTKREQLNSNGENYTVDALIGAITPINLNPFIRFYDEEITGTIVNGDQQTTPSWGPGIRWLASSHVIIDLSYNFVADETISEDYIAATFEWEPSARTSLAAGYSKRFFGDSYNLDFNHRTRRLTNNISYNESLESFDRNNYQTINLGGFWCPSTGEVSSVADCFQPLDNSEQQLIPLSSLEPIESTEFSLNKRLSWLSELQLSRTSFVINISANERKGLESNIIDQYFDAGFTITRNISAKSSLSLSTKFRFNDFDKENPAGSRQTDYYRTNMATYTKKLALSLSTHFSIQHVNRDSTIDRYSYDEMRAVINITKDF